MEIESIIELAEGLATEHRGKSGGGDPFVAFEDYEVIVAEANFGNAFEGLLRFKDDELGVFSVDKAGKYEISFMPEVQHWKAINLKEVRVIPIS